MAYLRLHRKLSTKPESHRHSGSIGHRRHAALLQVLGWLLMAAFGSQNGFQRAATLLRLRLLVSLAEGNLNFFGISNHDQLKLQVYAGSSWQPSSTDWWSLGDTLNPYTDNEAFQV